MSKTTLESKTIVSKYDYEDYLEEQIVKQGRKEYKEGRSLPFEEL